MRKAVAAKKRGIEREGKTMYTRLAGWSAEALNWSMGVKNTDPRFAPSREVGRDP